MRVSQRKLLLRVVRAMLGSTPVDVHIYVYLAIINTYINIVTIIIKFTLFHSIKRLYRVSKSHYTYCVNEEAKTEMKSLVQSQPLGYRKSCWSTPRNHWLAVYVSPLGSTTSPLLRSAA